MWLASRTNVFTCFCIFLAKEFGNPRDEKKNQKNQRRIFKESESVDNDRDNS